MTKVKDKLNKVTGWLGSNCFAEEELYILQAKVNEAVRRVEEMRQCYEGSLTVDDLIRAKESLEKASVPMYHFNIPSIDGNVLLTFPLANLSGSISTPYHEHDLYSILNNIPVEGKKESEMCYKCNPQSSTANATVVAVAADPTKDMRDHLTRRLNRVYSEKTDKVYRYFYTVDEPKTKEETLTRLKEGKFSLSDDSFDKDGKLCNYRDAMDSFTWRLAPVDVAAFTIAHDATSAEYTKTNDTIAVMSPEQGLEALRAFEAWQPTGVAN